MQNMSHAAPQQPWQGFSEPGTLLSISKQAYSATRVECYSLAGLQKQGHASLSARFDLLASAGTGVVFGVT